MTDVHELAARNAAFADARPPVAALRINPSGNLMIIGCVDPRVDPSIVLGLALGEAAVIRNVGGRVTPQTLRTMALLAQVGQANADGRPEGDWNLVILHHTDCGMTDLAEFPDLLASYFEVAESELEAKAVSDPVRSVKVDVGVIRSLIPGGSDFLVSGLVYDVSTGRIDVVVPPRPLSERA
jgi:carbonic anhydrase